MSAAESPRPTPLSHGFSKLETLPEGFAEQMRREVEVGDIVGERYRVIRPIGHGAMGKVFLAENQAIGLRVAIKLLKPQLLANPDFRLRFKHEAEAIAAIKHPNVAHFLDLIVGDPTFLVMEYVDGPTLHQVIYKEGKLTPRRAADIATRLAWGLHAAHKAGVIHRDLKPSNILLSPDEEAGEVPKIIDFGLAKTSASPGAPLTRAGQIVGTPQYMAPEQIARKEVDARTDVYALGSVLYAMLCGRPPFIDNNDDMQLLYKQVHEPVEPVRAHAPHVSGALEAVVLRALEKSPADRFQSARDFARALVPAVEKRAPRERSEVTEVIMKPRAPRSPAWWVALAVALMIVGVAVALVLARRAPSGGMLILISNPADADIFVDGKATGERTPTALRAMKPGEHTVRLHHDRFSDLERTVRIDDGGRQTIDAYLLPRTHTIEVATVPAGATVFVDGALTAGKTPLSLELTDGEYHAVRIEKPGYETVLRKLKPDENGALPTIVLAPETQPRATIYVDAAAPAAVWIDGQYSGFMTPTPGLVVAAGEHTLQLRDGHDAVLDDVHARVQQGETARLVLQLRPAKRGKR
ncbi:MAG: serine/threonine protein kinase [bacterium]|nr:serine/threonine protein kinase [bacterium]